jgi:hypothetical protein
MARFLAESSRLYIIPLGVDGLFWHCIILLLETLEPRNSSMESFVAFSSIIPRWRQQPLGTISLPYRFGQLFPITLGLRRQQLIADSTIITSLYLVDMGWPHSAMALAASCLHAFHCTCHTSSTDTPSLPAFRTDFDACLNARFFQPRNWEVTGRVLSFGDSDLVCSF